MNRLPRLMLLLLCLSLLAGAVSGSRVGVYPGAVSLGTVERGETVAVDMLLVGGAAGDVITLSPKQPLLADFEPGEQGYEFSAENASQEDIRDWIEVVDKKVTLEPRQRFRIDGKVVPGNKQVRYLIHVPEDAEPGYHVGTLLPRIQESAAGDGTNINTQTVTRHNVIFRVPGKAVRDVAILGFNGRRYSEIDEEVFVLVHNTGTVTTTVTLNPFITYNDTTVQLSRKGVKLAPDEIKKVRTIWDVRDMPETTYTAGATASWLTGSTNNTGSVTVTGFTAAPQRAGTAKQETGPDNTVALIVSALAVLLTLLAGRTAWKRRQEGTIT